MMTGNMVSMRFDYGDLSAEKVLECETAFQTACAIENQATRMIGEQFAKAKENLKHLRHGNGWGEWCEKRLNISRQSAENYINEYRNGKFVKNFDKFGKSARFLLCAPTTPQEVIDRADALAEAGEDVSVKTIKKLKADCEAEREARELFERRAQESQAESNERRKKIRELETTVGQLQTELDIAKTVLENQPEKEKIVAPDDYEATKQKASLLAGELDNLKKHQASVVQSQVTAKLKERERELAELDSKIKGAEAVLKGLQEGLDRYSNQQRELQVHLDVIEKARVAMTMLAANMEGFESVIDHDNELRLWRALSQMLRNGAEAIDFFVGDAKPRLVA